MNSGLKLKFGFTVLPTPLTAVNHGWWQVVTRSVLMLSNCGVFEYGSLCYVWRVKRTNGCWTILGLFSWWQKIWPKGRSGAKTTIMKNRNSTQNKSQTHRAKQYKVTSFLSTDCELSTETCSKNVYSLGPRLFGQIVRRKKQHWNTIDPYLKYY